MPDEIKEPEATPVTPPPEAPKEPVKEPPKEAPKEPEFMSEKFAALARKEKAITKNRQELSALKADLERKSKEMDAQMAEFKRWQKIKENAKLDPDTYLSEAGLSYGYLSEKALKGEKFDGKEILAATRAEVDALRKEQEEERKKAAESQKTQAEKDFQDRVTNFVQGIYNFVEENKETYELIDLHGQQDLIFQVINEASNRKLKMSVKEAADKVETYLAEQVEKAITTSKKFKEKYLPKKVEETPEPGSPTLTNSMSTTTPTSPAFISDKERTARALHALNKALGEA